VRSLHAAEPQFPGDDGAADPAVLAALTAYAAGRGSEHAALNALASSRLLVPVVALLTEEAGEDIEADDSADVPGTELRREKTTEMAMPTLIGRDGRSAVLAFTSLDALTRWRPDARPVAVPAARAWQAGAEEASAVVIDVAGPVPVTVEGARLAALAAGRPAPLPHQDPDVLAALHRALGNEPLIVQASLTTPDQRAGWEYGPRPEDLPDLAAPGGPDLGALGLAPPGTGSPGQNGAGPDTIGPDSAVRHGASQNGAGGDSAARYSTARNNVDGDSAAGDSATGASAHGVGAAGAAATKTSAAGTSAMGDSAAGGGAGSGSAGHDALGRDAAARDTAAQDTAGPDAAGRGQAGPDAAGRGTAGADAAGRGQAGADAAGRGQAGADAAGRGQAGADDTADLALQVTLADGCDPKAATAAVRRVAEALLTATGGRLRRGMEISVAPPRRAARAR
jgi:hypothetical protein